LFYFIIRRRFFF